MSVKLIKEGVVVECLLVNASTRRVNFKSLSEVSSSSSPNGTGGSGLSGRLGLLVLRLGFLLEDLQMKVKCDSTGWGGKPSERR